MAAADTERWATRHPGLAQVVLRLALVAVVALVLHVVAPSPVVPVAVTLLGLLATSPRLRAAARRHPIAALVLGAGAVIPAVAWMHRQTSRALGFVPTLDLTLPTFQGPVWMQTRAMAMVLTGVVLWLLTRRTFWRLILGRGGGHHGR
jgi:hypothetical protein